MANCRVLIEETGDDLIFLHKESEGGARRSCTSKEPASPDDNPVVQRLST